MRTHKHYFLVPRTASLRNFLNGQPTVVTQEPNISGIGRKRANANETQTNVRESQQPPRTLGCPLNPPFDPGAASIAQRKQPLASARVRPA